MKIIAKASNINVSIVNQQGVEVAHANYTDYDVMVDVPEIMKSGFDLGLLIKQLAMAGEKSDTEESSAE